jgi:hypothetical protein
MLILLTDRFTRAWIGYCGERKLPSPPLSRWQVQPPLFGLMAVRFAGLALIAMGTPALLDSFARFASQVEKGIAGR